MVWRLLVTNTLVVPQLIASFLSVPLVSALLTWMAGRLSRENRLLSRVERLAALRVQLPNGRARQEYEIIFLEVLTSLNAELDPVSKRERRSKRRVVGLLALAVVVVAIWVPGASAPSWVPSALGLALGGVGLLAFWLVERASTRERLARRAHSARSSTITPCSREHHTALETEA